MILQGFYIDVVGFCKGFLRSYKGSVPLTMRVLSKISAHESRMAMFKDTVCYQEEVRFWHAECELTVYIRLRVLGFWVQGRALGPGFGVHGAGQRRGGCFGDVAANYLRPKRWS